MQKLNEVIIELSKGLNGFELHLAVDAIYEFVWHEFADKYIEQSKKRREETQPVLEEVFNKCLFYFIHSCLLRQKRFIKRCQITKTQL